MTEYSHPVGGVVTNLLLIMEATLLLTDLVVLTTEIVINNQVIVKVEVMIIFTSQTSTKEIDHLT